MLPVLPHHSRPLALALALLATLVSSSLLAQDPFALGVRETPWLPPADQQKAFKLPDGFSINLVAAEPQIQKPLNMAFDVRGRIWLTDSVEYPYAAPLDKPGRDTVKILEDVDRDGHYEKVTTFADGLNIPIGIYPHAKGCIVYSIPNVWLLEDTDGDDKCDKRTILYGPFDHTRDTHGMVNAMRRGFDGWLYACHGFNNQSKVQGSDGHPIEMNSGNTFRMRLDGSRVENFTFGQVNPFGMAIDNHFQLFTADCHSKPLYALIPGGSYPSFGRPHDGLGFVPEVMTHLHGSTAICGVTLVTGDVFPEEFQGKVLSGNVMTSRINCNTLESHGSTIKAVEQPDFLSTTDPWFRPVDVQMGPDGALYVLDFYNRIIGHYEVPLTHPGRDRTSGRIWRVTYTKNSPKVPAAVDLTQLPAAELLEACNHPVIAQRLLALHQLSDVVYPQQTEALQQLWRDNLAPRSLIALAWTLARHDALAADKLAKLAAHDQSEVRTHAMRIAGFLGKKQQDSSIPLVSKGIGDTDGHVRLAALEAAAKFDSRELMTQISETFSKPTDDVFALQAAKIALRDQLARLPTPSSNDWQYVGILKSRIVASAIPAVKNELGGNLAAELFKLDHDLPPTYWQVLAEHAARYASETKRATLLADIDALAKRKQLPLHTLMQAVARGAQQRGGGVPPVWIEHLTKLMATTLTINDDTPLGWNCFTLDGQPITPMIWEANWRKATDEDSYLMYTSLPAGEQRTSILRSDPFKIPEELSFWSCGHVGFTGAPSNHKNKIRLVDAATGEVLIESEPPRNDIAHRIVWDLKKFAGRPGKIELVDSDDGTGYAWIAAGHFSLKTLNVSDWEAAATTALELVKTWKLRDAQPAIVALVSSSRAPSGLRRTAAETLASLEGSAIVSALAGSLIFDLPEALRSEVSAAITSTSAEAREKSLALLLSRLASREQERVTQLLATDASGTALFTQLIERGILPARLLAVRTIEQSAMASATKDDAEKLTAIKAALPAEAANLDQLIEEKQKTIASLTADLARGQQIFTKSCANCHQVAGAGAIVGPQLDGIGLRGRQRLLEDMLDPHRNVDVAFRTTTLLLDDGRVITGLVRREEGATLVLADPQGKEQFVEKASIEQRKQTPLSLMPENIARELPSEDLAHLVAWLLAQKQAKEPMP